MQLRLNLPYTQLVILHGGAKFRGKSENTLRINFHAFKFVTAIHRCKVHDCENDDEIDSYTK